MFPPDRGPNVVFKTAVVAREKMLCSVPVHSLRAIHTEQPPPGVFASFSGLPVEIDFHRTVGTGIHLIPVFANIHFRTSMMAFPGFAPGAQHGRDPDGLAPPKELTGKTGLP